MSEHIDISSSVNIGELLRDRHEASQRLQEAEERFIETLLHYRNEKIPVRVVGYSGMVAVARYDEDGAFKARTTVGVGPINRDGEQGREPRTIERGIIAGVHKEMMRRVVQVKPENTENLWMFSLGSIIEIERLPSPRIQTQRAILGAVNSGLMHLEVRDES